MPTKYHTLSTDAARELILSQRVNGRGCIFAIAFTRKTTSQDDRRKKGEQEVVYCRFGVTKHLAAGKTGWHHPDGKIRRYWGEGARPAGAAYDRAAKGCCCVYVVGRKGAKERASDPSVLIGYRSISFSSINWLKLDGTIYKVGVTPPAQH